MIKVKTTTPSKRCDVCHQSDCFDPVSESCTRCNKLAQTEVKPALELGITPSTTPVVETTPISQIDFSSDYFDQSFWRTSRLFKLSLFLPLLYTVLMLFLIDKDYRIPDRFSFINLAVMPIFIVKFLFDLYGAHLPIKRLSLSARMKLHKVSCMILSSTIVISHLARHYLSPPDLETPTMWIVNILLPLLYILMVLFIRDKEYPTAIRILKDRN